MKLSKWLMVLFLGGFAVLILFSTLRRLIPVEMDGEKAKFFGGALTINYRDRTLKLGKLKLRDDLEYQHFGGSRNIDPASVTRVRIPFTNGKMSLRSSSDQRLVWNCNLNQKDAGSVAQADGELTIDLGKARGAQCGFQIPANLRVSLDGTNGEISIIHPDYPLEAKLVNGQVEVRPNPERQYRYDLNVANGIKDRFDSSSREDALRISVALMNGNIRRN